MMARFENARAIDFVFVFKFLFFIGNYKYD